MYVVQSRVQNGNRKKSIVVHPSLFVCLLACCVQRKERRNDKTKRNVSEEAMQEKAQQGHLQSPPKRLCCKSIASTPSNRFHSIHSHFSHTRPMATPGCFRHMTRSGWCFAMVDDSVGQSQCVCVCVSFAFVSCWLDSELVGLDRFDVIAGVESKSNNSEFCFEVY